MYLIALSIRFWKTCRRRALADERRQWRINHQLDPLALQIALEHRRSRNHGLDLHRLHLLPPRLIRLSSSSSVIRSVSICTFCWIRSRRWMTSSSNFSLLFISSIAAMPEMLRSGALRSCETARRKSSFSAISALRRLLAASNWLSGLPHLVFQVVVGVRQLLPLLLDFPHHFVEPVRQRPDQVRPVDVHPGFQVPRRDLVGCIDELADRQEDLPHQRVDRRGRSSKARRTRPSPARHRRDAAPPLHPARKCSA